MISNKAMMMAVGAVLLLSGCGEKAATSAGAPAAKAVDGKWTETTSMTAEGGTLMGNPGAAVKLVEYGALTCSHCADFSRDSAEGLKAMIAKGTVSYEFRPFLLNVMDVPASLVARCAGPGPFFTIAEQLFATQREWLGKTASITPAEQAQWANLPPEQLSGLLGEKLGLVEFVQQRGVSADKAKACLTDKTAVDQLGQVSKTGSDQYKISGTPTFIINGLVLPGVGDWKALEPELKKAGA